jgi:hypothetical protein
MSEKFPDDSADESLPVGAVEMAEGEVENETEEDANGRAALPFAEDCPDDPAVPRPTFLSYLSSPVVTLLVGAGEESETILTAHQALLVRSPFFKEACSEFSDDGDGSVSLSMNPESISCLFRPASPLC